MDILYGKPNLLFLVVARPTFINNKYDINVAVGKFHLIVKTHIMKVSEMFVKKLKKAVTTSIILERSIIIDKSDSTPLLDKICILEIGTKLVLCNGQLHNDTGPAIFIHKNGKMMCVYWRYGKIHRDDGPAIRCAEFDAWCSNGGTHRDDFRLFQNEKVRGKVGGPAIIVHITTRKYHYVHHGVTHRTNGPAVIHTDGSYEWFLNGKIHRDQRDSKNKLLPALKLGIAEYYYMKGIQVDENGDPLYANVQIDM